MAQIIGTSGAWKDVLKLLKIIDVDISHPQEIQLKINAFKRNYEKLNVDFEGEVRDLKNAIHKWEMTVKNDVINIKESTQNAVQKLDLQLTEIEKESQQNYEQAINNLQQEFKQELWHLKNTVQQREFALDNDIKAIKEPAQSAIQKLDLQLTEIEKESQRNYEQAVNNLQKKFEQELQDLRNIVQKQESTLETDIKTITESTRQDIQKLDQQIAQIEKEMLNDVQFFDEKISQINQLYNDKINEFYKQLNSKPEEFYKTIAFLNDKITLKSGRFTNKLEYFSLEIRTEIYNFKTTKGFFKKLLILLSILGIKIRRWKFSFTEKLDIAELKFRKEAVLRAEENRLIDIKRNKWDAENKRDKEISAITASKSKKIRDNEHQVKNIKNHRLVIQTKANDNIQLIHTTLNDNRKKLQYFEHNRPEIMAKRRQHLDSVTRAQKEKQLKSVINQKYSIQTKEAEDIQRIHITLNNSREKLAYFEQNSPSIMAKQRQHLETTMKVQKEKQIKSIVNQRYKILAKEAEDIQRIYKTLSDSREKLEYLEQNKPAVMAKRRQSLDDEMEFLERLMSSSEWIGAITELEVIESLRHLPDSYYVLNDVHLQINRPVYVQKKAVLSAQVDHLVITPAGIFVIETKHWSKQFVESGDFFDPYEQVTRASHLCYKLLKMNFNKEIKTRSIIAYHGYLPKKSEEYYVKILEIQDINGYIAWFKSSIFSKDDVLKITHFFKKNFL